MSVQMQVTSSRNLARDWLIWQRDRHEHPEKYPMLSTGLATLDDCLGGGRERGQLLYLGGGPKSGKTTLLKTFAMEDGRCGRNFIWFGAEMNNLQTGTLLFSNISGIDRTRIRNPNTVLALADWAKLEDAAAEIETYSGYWTYGFSTLQDILEMITSIESDGVVIDSIYGDYIQLMEQPGMRDPQTELKYISRGLKKLTISHIHAKTKEPVLISVNFAAQFNRASVLAQNYSKSSFLGSGSLERDCDIGLGVQEMIDPVTGIESETVRQVLFLAGREYKSSRPLTVGYNGACAEFYDLPESQSTDPEIVNNVWR